MPLADTDPNLAFDADATDGVPIIAVAAQELETALDGAPLSPAQRRFAAATGFTGKAGTHCVLPDADGGIGAVLFGAHTADAAARDPFRPLALGALAQTLPAGAYRLEEGFDEATARLAWGLGAYRFGRYRATGETERVDPARLTGRPDDATRRALEAVYLTRDLVNTPANDVGPDALEAAMRALAARHAAEVTSIAGDDLLTAPGGGFPMVHAVGRASASAPRVVDMVWGAPDAPRVTLVGKGVTFDTGGLNIKPGQSMALMKKDMGGAANVLGLAHLIMDARLPVRLRVIVGAVENAISGNAFRPGDILASRKGITVEIGNTDAEGRLVLGDCLALADADEPDLLIDMATLTGAARVALGPDLPPLFTRDAAFCARLVEAGMAVGDPVWAMPLWQPYAKMLESKVADVSHISSGAFAGAVTAALFLEKFVERAAVWAHLDVFAWTPTARPHAPVGGEAQSIRALADVLAARYG